VNKTVLTVLAGALLAAVAPLMCRRALRRGNTQVHRINQ
jgi:hypothetical protein